MIRVIPNRVGNMTTVGKCTKYESARVSTAEFVPRGTVLISIVLGVPNECSTWNTPLHARRIGTKDSPVA